MCLLFFFVCKYVCSEILIVLEFGKIKLFFSWLEYGLIFLVFREIFNFFGRVFFGYFKFFYWEKVLGRVVG